MHNGSRLIGLYDEFSAFVSDKSDAQFLNLTSYLFFFNSLTVTLGGEIQVYIPTFYNINIPLLLVYYTVEYIV